MVDKVVTVHVEDIDGGYVVACSTDGSLTSAEVPAEALDVQGVRALAIDAAEGYATSEEARRRGEALYSFLVGDRPWTRAFAADLDQDGHIHIRLDIRSPLLRLLPWELMYHEGFLALVPKVRISRTGCAHLAARPTHGAVTVLVLLPDGADESSDREADAVFEALSPAQRDGLVVARQVPYRLPAPPARLGGCDILHISGRYGELVGNEDWLVAVCQQASPLLVYCSCYADGPEPHVAAIGVAPEVTSTAAGFPNLAAILQREAGIPVALSLEGRTTGASLSTAADEFYRGLAGGLPTPAAVARARRQVALALEPGHAAVAERLLDWAGLVLYQSDEHGLLLTEAGLVSTAAEPATAIRGDEEPAQRSARMMKNGAPDPFGSLARRDVQRWSVKPRRRALGGIATGPGEGQAALLSSLARALGESASQGESDDAVLDRVRAGLSTHPVEEKTLDLLREALRSDDRRRQVAAVEALGLIGGGQPAARDILVMLVAGPECGTVAPIVRHTAIRQLGRIADQPAIEALLLTMVDPDQEVRELARQALAHASRSAGATLGQARIRLPLQSVEAMRWVAPLRRAIANDKDLPPRQRVDKMAEVEALRLELIRPRPRPSRLGALFENLDGMSPEIKSLVLDLKKRIEWGVPGGERLDPGNAASLGSRPGFDGGGAR